MVFKISADGWRHDVLVSRPVHDEVNPRTLNYRRITNTSTGQGDDRLLTFRFV